MKLTREDVEKRVDSARADMQRLARRNEGSTLNHLEKFLQSREQTYEAFRRMDPESSHTQEALALLEKARSELANFKERFGDKPSSALAQDDPPTETAQDEEPGQPGYEAD